MDILETLSDGWESIKEFFVSIPENVSSSFSELNSTTIVLAILFWAIFAFMFDFMPGMIGLESFSLSNKIILTVLLLPISYFIVHYMINRG